MQKRFAQNTTVSVEKTRAEIESLVVRYGASRFGSGWQEGHAHIAFVMRDRAIRFTLPLPDKADKKFQWTDGKRKVRTPEQRLVAWEQDCRRNWRALLLAIKAKLEAVETGISEFDHEFLAFIVDPATGRTIGEAIVPRLIENYSNTRAAKAIELHPVDDPSVLKISETEAG